MRDFNTILDTQEKTERKKVDMIGLKEFNEWIKDIDTVNIPSRGLEYIWSNNRDEDKSVYLKIDHMFCNEH